MSSARPDNAFPRLFHNVHPTLAIFGQSPSSDRHSIAIIRLALNQSDYFTIDDYPSRCRDDKDDYLQALSLQSHVDYLVSGDIDLLVLGKIGDTAIIPPSAFLSILTAL